MIQILEEPTGVTYKQLISLAFTICDEFILVKRDQIELSEKAKHSLRNYNTYKRDYKARRMVSDNSTRK